MNRSFAVGWLLILAGGAAALGWNVYGRAAVRRARYVVPEISASRRTEAEFVAILIPRIRRGEEKFTMTPAELTALLGGLRDSGHTPIGLADVEAFYSRGRLLPPKALLLAFAENDPRGYALSDRVLKKLRWRGVAFVRRTADGAGDEERQYLTGHAIDQMRRSGAWDFGWAFSDAPGAAGAAALGRALLREEGPTASSAAAGRYPLAFIASELGYNDAHARPTALRMLALRPDRAEQNLAIVEKAWPRGRGHADDFRADAVGTDWIAGWGVLPMGNRRLKLLPTPRHTSAGIYLRGTETWRDSSVEFILARYRKEFWAYARLQEGESFVRVGARDGWWYAEQKAAPDKPVNMLARAPMGDGALPATVRFVLKGGSLLVFANGRMQFGRPLTVSPAVARGRLFLGTYDAKVHASMAVLSSVRAAPLGEVWIAPVDLSRELDAQALAALREEAARARVVSPSWLSVSSDGEVRVDEAQGILLRSMAGFYACRLLPTVELGTGFRAAGLDSRLAAAARELEVPGLNLRLRGGGARDPEMIALVSRARRALRAQGRELWVTIDGGEADPALALAADGVLRPSRRTRRSLEIFESARPARAKTAPQAAALL